jgi:hypothetical protein
MIVNGYSVLLAFVALVETALGVAVAGAGIAAIRRRRREGVGAEAATESRFALLFLVAAVLLGVSVASWPLLYLVLDSYVAQWPGVMCVRGVSRIGTGSLGAAGWLPALVRVLELAKPALLFASGAWLVLHLANRRTKTAPLTNRVLGTLAVVGVLAAVDGAAQLAYLGIPKEESFLAAGCCTTPPAELADRGGRGLSALSAAAPDRARPVLLAAFFGLALAMSLGTGAWARRPASRFATSTWGVATLAVGAGLAVPLGVATLHDVLSPAFLGVPDHHCVYCVLSGSAVGVVGIALWLLGAFATGWACVARRLAAGPETGPFLDAQVARLASAALFGWLAAAALAASQWAVS